MSTYSNKSIWPNTNFEIYEATEIKMIDIRKNTYFIFKGYFFIMKNVLQIECYM